MASTNATFPSRALTPQAASGKKTNEKRRVPPCPGTLKAARRPPVAGAERTLHDAAAHRPRPPGDSE